jgi:hypothetical protein
MSPYIPCVAPRAALQQSMASCEESLDLKPKEQFNFWNSAS